VRGAVRTLIFKLALRQRLLVRRDDFRWLSVHACRPRRDYLHWHAWDANLERHGSVACSWARVILFIMFSICGVHMTCVAQPTRIDVDPQTTLRYTPTRALPFLSSLSLSKHEKRSILQVSVFKLVRLGGLCIPRGSEVSPRTRPRPRALSMVQHNSMVPRNKHWQWSRQDGFFL